jgi:GNAT superfamily N-acetyltransferase
MTLENVSIEPFRGDLENLERMAHLSWRDEYGAASFPNFYRPDFLRFLFDRIPQAEKDHLIAAYRGDEIVAFLANLPQRFHFRGKIYRAIYSCLLVTRKEFLRQGMAIALIQEALRTNRKYNYDFSLLTLETGHRSTKLMDKFKGEGQRLEWVRKTNVIARILDLGRVGYSEGLKGWEKAAIKLLGSHRPPKKTPDVALRKYKPADVDQCLALVDRYKETVTLALAWDKKDLGWELDYPGVSETLVYEKEGRVQGMINFIRHEHLGKTKEPWAWINHVAYPDLSGGERYEFVQAFLKNIQEAGFVGTIEWNRKYYPLRPFYRSRFFPYFRGVNLVSWTFNTEISLANIPDVYEVQI